MNLDQRNLCETERQMLVISDEQLLIEYNART